MSLSFEDERIVNSCRALLEEPENFPIEMPGETYARLRAIAEEPFVEPKGRSEVVTFEEFQRLLDRIEGLLSAEREQHLQELEEQELEEAVKALMSPQTWEPMIDAETDWS